MAQAPPPHTISPPNPVDLSPTNMLESWKLFKQTWGYYVLIAELDKKPDILQQAYFLKFIGEPALKVFNTFTWDDGNDANPENTLTLANIITKLDAYIIGEVNETVERYNFNQRCQKEEESIDTYVTALRTLAKTCSFCDCLSDSLIRDRMVVGIRDSQARKRLLQMRNLSLKKCIDICKGFETATKNLKRMTSEQSTDEVNRVGVTQKSKGARRKKSSARSTSSDAEIKRCKFCGREHPMDKTQCPAYGQTCTKCKRLNHFASMCKTKKVNYVDEEDSRVNSIDSSSDGEMIGSVGDRKGKLIYAEMLVHKIPVRFQVDCGASPNIIPEKHLNQSDVVNPKGPRLEMWNGSSLKPLGTCRVNVKNPKTEKKYNLEFVVVRGNQMPLIGSQAAQEMGLLKVLEENFTRVAAVATTKGEILKEYGDVFDKSKIGAFEGEVHLEVRPEAKPVVLPARRVPVSRKDKLKQELEKLKSRDVITPVENPTDWVSQYVITEKKSGEVRLCIDPRPLNAALKRERYPLPTLDDHLPDLANAKLFTKVDLSKAFWHCILDEESSMLTTFSTPFGRYRWRRLPFGLCVSSEIFQRKLHMALAGLEGVVCIADDVAIWGRNEEHHEANLKGFMERCRKTGIILNPDKLELELDCVTYHGHLLTADGLKVDPGKVEGIDSMPDPKTREEVGRLNGMINYLSRFMPRLSDTMLPVRQLLKDEVPWRWEAPQVKAMAELRHQLTHAPVLAYYDPTKELRIQCDASGSGLGAALLQEGRPIAYTSRALTDTETRYAPIELEMLAIVFSLEKFHQYTYGRHTIVHSDHKPLESIMKKPLHKAPRRLQGMMLRLQMYDIEVRYQQGKTMALADALSRAHPTGQKLQHDAQFETVSSMLCVKDEKLKQLKDATAIDETSTVLKRTISEGWPATREDCHNLIMPYFNVRDELGLQDGLIFRGERVVIPHSMREDMKKCLHSSHLGIEGCKRRARESIFWPGMNDEIRQFISKCETCQSFQPAQQTEPLMPIEIPSRPWKRVGTDLFKFEQRNYLVTVDYYSGFIEVDKLESTDTKAVIHKLKAHFARHGIPEEVISDNGPQYSAQEFANFAATWGFNHCTSSPHRSQANGKAEAAVKVVKQLMRKAVESNSDPYLALLDHRNTPSEKCQSSPAQRLFNRRTRTLLPTTESLLAPKVVAAKDRLKERQMKMKELYDKGAKPLNPLEEGDVVRMKPFKLTDKTWSKAVISKRLDERSYLVETDDGSEYRRNRQDLRSSNEDQTPQITTPNPEPILEQILEAIDPIPTQSNPTESATNSSQSQNVSPRKSAQSPSTKTKTPASTATRHSTRLSVLPKDFRDSGIYQLPKKLK